MTGFDEDESPTVDLPPADVTIKLEGWHADDVQRAIATHVARMLLPELQKRIDSEIDKAVDMAIASGIDEAVRKRIEHDVVAMLDEGFKVTNEYGYQKETITVRGRIEEAFKPDRYSGRGSSLPKIIDDAIAKRFNAELESATKRVREHVDELLRTTIDAAVMDRIRAALGSAFGVHVPK